MITVHKFSKKEEIANALTHGVGVILSIAALILLIGFSTVYGTPKHVLSFTIYGITMVMLYVSSTMLHSLPDGKLKNVFEIMDHASIYLFIAGTYTPILCVVVRGTLGWTLLGIVWGLAAAGIIFKVFFVKRFLFLSTLFYILMGWLALFAIGPLIEKLPPAGLALLILGGVSYTIGTVFFIWRLFKYHHAVWHVFVLSGSILHFLLILLYVLPIQ